MRGRSSRAPGTTETNSVSQNRRCAPGSRPHTTMHPSNGSVSPRNRRGNRFSRLGRQRVSQRSRNLRRRRLDGRHPQSLVHHELTQH
uniref:Uncharacterized protein n=1 Tax=Rhodococcus sp. NS1 TaxID=402236 RepID=A0A097SQG8_9NOCA|nr:hypothetical protein LRS1606.328 [Rhodococcus sp. NS1]